MARRRFARHSLVLAASLGATLAAPLALAQAAKFPSKQIRIVVPFQPGGLTDAYARLFGEHLTQQLGASVLVENKSGGGAVIGIDAVAKAPPDGYTLLVTTTGTVMQNRVLYTKLPYNLDKDLTPITVFPSGPLAVGVSPSVPARNLAEFVAWAKGKELSMGSYAPGSYPHMMADLFSRNYGLKVQVVHYRGEAPMWVDVAGGQVQVAVGSYQAFNTVSTRGVKAIGVTGKYRSPRLPDVPTLIEQGVTGTLVPLEGGLVLMAPTGTPEAVLQALSAVVVKGAETPQAAKLRENFGIPNKPKNLAETRRDWDRDVPAWIKAASDLGVKLD
ncbi:MAG: tripartite tricarboxylate transporter substrate binding protein [Burkholderiales bacterium]|nr:tripartite tricarboxylate transporter substrate binding protein [Burkholderiales bacterium]